MHALKFADSMLFLSTLSLRRATINQKKNQPGKSFLSTLSLRRATLYLDNKTTQLAISIHALLAESDLLTRITGFSAGVFLSTLSLRRATRVLDGSKSSIEDFYPRSPCGERRFSAGRESDTEENFYPRSPCGERPKF